MILMCPPVGVDGYHGGGLSVVMVGCSQMTDPSIVTVRRTS